MPWKTNERKNSFNVVRDFQYFANRTDALNELKLNVCCFKTIRGKERWWVYSVLQLIYDSTSSASLVAYSRVHVANTDKELHKHVLLCSHAKRCSCPYFFMKSSTGAPWQTERISWHGSAPLSVSPLLFTVQTHLPFTHKWLLRVVQW